METPMWDMYSSNIDNDASWNMTAENETSDYWKLYSTNSGDSDSSWNVTETASSWLDSLSNAMGTAVTIKNQYDQITGKAQAEQIQREYEKVEQEQQIVTTQAVNNQNLVYGGIALVAGYLIFGGD